MAIGHCFPAQLGGDHDVHGASLEVFSQDQYQIQLPHCTTVPCTSVKFLKLLSSQN